MIPSGNRPKSVSLFAGLGTSWLCFVCPRQPENSTQGTEKARAVGEEYPAGSLQKGGTVAGVLRSMLLRLPSLPPLSPPLPSQFTYNISVHSGSFWGQGTHDAHFPHPTGIPPVFPSPALSPVEAALVLLPAQIPQFQIRGHPSLVGRSNSAVGAIAVTPSPASLVPWTMPPQFPSLPHSQPCSQPDVFPCFFSPASVLPTCLFRTSRHSLFSSCS